MFGFAHFSFARSHQVGISCSPVMREIVNGYFILWFHWFYVELTALLTIPIYNMCLAWSFEFERIQTSYELIIVCSFWWLNWRWSIFRRIICSNRKLYRNDFPMDQCDWFRFLLKRPKVNLIGFGGYLRRKFSLCQNPPIYYWECLAPAYFYSVYLVDYGEKTIATWTIGCK